MIQFWGVEEVGQWLENIGLPEYKELFARHDIRGTELLGLDRPDLKVILKIGYDIRAVAMDWGLLKAFCLYISYCTM